MKRTSVVAKIIVLLLALTGSLACGISSQNLMATHEVVLRPTIEEEAGQTAVAGIGTAVSATLTVAPVTQKVALMSFHGRFVTASGGGAGWLLRQEQDLTDCGWFTLQRLENGKVSLMTCHSRYVTAPKTGGPREDWLLWQEWELRDCGKFVLHDLGRDGVALETCAEKFVTAGDGNWPGELRWSLVGETDKLETWERFAMLERYPPPPVIADFDDCTGVTNSGQPTGEVYDPGSGDRADASFVREPGHGCIARLEYDLAGATGMWLRLGKIDLSPYSQLAFDMKLNSEENAPEECRIELKRADLQEISILPITGITTDWQTLSVNLSEFQGSLTSMADMEELVFMFEAGEGRKTGVIYLDNVVLRRD